MKNVAGKVGSGSEHSGTGGTGLGCCSVRCSGAGVMNARASCLLTHLILLYFNHLPAFSGGILLYPGLDRQR